MGGLPYLWVNIIARFFSEKRKIHQEGILVHFPLLSIGHAHNFVLITLIVVHYALKIILSRTNWWYFFRFLNEKYEECRKNINSGGCKKRGVYCFICLYVSLDEKYEECGKIIKWSSRSSLHSRTATFYSLMELARAWLRSLLQVFSIIHCENSERLMLKTQWRLLAAHPRNPTHHSWLSSDPIRRYLSNF